MPTVVASAAGALAAKPATQRASPVERVAVGAGAAVRIGFGVAQLTVAGSAHMPRGGAAFRADGYYRAASGHNFAVAAAHPVTRAILAANPTPPDLHLHR